MTTSPDPTTTTTVLLLVLVAVLLFQARRPTRSRRVPSLSPSIPLHLVHDADGNECLVLDAVFAHGQRCLFLLDTAYAGAPVLSTSYLALLERLRGEEENVQRRYAQTVAALRRRGKHEATSGVRRLLRGGVCRAYTSGCTMRLMGIGETVEQQSDLLLCPSLRFLGENRSSFVPHGAAGDVFVTNPLPGTPHILTTDYLLHRAPCLLRPGAQTLTFHATDRRGFEWHTPRLVGGAFAVPMTVGGTTLSIVLDTGASAALSLSPAAAERVRTCRSANRVARQRGVNGEEVCSDVLLATVTVGRRVLTVPELPVFANTHDVQGADGYAGMALLRAVDLWLDHGKVGLRPSGLAPSSSMTTASHGTCGKERARCANESRG